MIKARIRDLGPDEPVADVEAISFMLGGVPTGTLHRWASLDGWPRRHTTTIRGRRTEYSITAAKATYERQRVPREENPAMADMDALVLWLRGEIAEKRRRAMRTQWTAGGPPAAWTYDRTRFRVTSLDPNGYQQGVAHRRAGVGSDGEPYNDTLLDVDGEHMELNDPQAAVAECDAHTAILDEHHNKRWPEQLGKGIDCTCGQPVMRGSGCRTVRALALAYRHRPGYREEWRP